MINYRYNILAKIGEGGAGEVFLTEDLLTGHRIALKFLSPVRCVEQDSIRGEFSVLADLSHPDLVRVFEFGTVMQSDDGCYTGRHFYTMEYLEGKDAIGYFAAIPEPRTKIEFLEEVFIQTLGVLDYIHRRGVVHFDIKPHNLFILVDGENRVPKIKLTDFGFSTSTIEEVDTPLRGTLEYTAPEIVQGHSTDHRADLYSLGITFFHLWMGYCPFEAESPVDLLKKVLTEQLPVVKSEKNVSSKLPEIIAALCQKNPDHRPQCARDVLMMFASNRYEERIKHALYIDRDIAFVGREKETKIIDGVLEELKKSEKDFVRTVVIRGAQGMGKSALLGHIMKNARRNGHLVVESSIGEEPFFSIVPVIRRLHIELQTRGYTYPLPVEILAERREMMPPPDSSLEQQERNELETKKELFVEFLQWASSLMPYLFLIDGLHLMDHFSFETVQSVLRGSRNGRIVALATIPDDVYDVSLSLDQTELVLSELTKEDVVVLIRSSLGEVFASTGAAERLHQLYGGAPAVVVEAVRSIAGALPLAAIHDVVAAKEMEKAVEEILSNKLEESFLKRFSKLIREKQLLVELLSCFEVSPSEDMLCRIVPFNNERMKQYLHSLECEGYITSLGETTQRYRLRHLKLKQCVYNRMTHEYQHLHAFLAENISEIKLTDWNDIEELGRQYELSCDKERALAYYRTAADTAYRLGAFAETFKLANKALACIADNHSDEYFHLMFRAAEACFALGSDSESVIIYSQMLKSLPEHDARCMQIHKALGKSFARLGKTTDALTHFESAIASTSGEKDRFEVQQEIISLKISEGKYDEVVSLSLRQKEIAAALFNDEMCALVETDLGIAQFFRGNFRESLQSFHIALEIYERHNKVKAIDALNNIGNVLSAMRDFRGALEKWEQALDRCTDKGTEYQRAQILNNIGIAHFKLQEFRKATLYYLSAKEIFDHLNSQSGSAFALTNLGEVTCAEGAYEQTLQYWTQSFDLYREMHDAEGMVQTLLGFAKLYLVLGNVEEACEKLDQAEEFIRQYQFPMFAGLMSYLRGVCFQTVGNDAEALVAFRNAESAFQQEGSFTGGSESEKDKWLLSILRQGEVHCALRQHARAVAILERLLTEHTSELSLHMKAEIYYLLGIVARECPTLVQGKALVFFREGLAFIQNDHISELSWKISYALGEEYEKRGNTEKAREHFCNGQRVLDYFISKFSSPELRDQYVQSGSRGRSINKLAT